MAKKRADVLLYEKGLVTSREKGKRLIMMGKVFIDTQRVDKPGERIDEDAEIYVKGDPIKYVSRGGLKLEKAMKEFQIDLKGKLAMDIGSSTGGFTDCMLQNGTRKVYAVDVGYGQLDWKLRNDERVVVMERTNIRHVDLDDIGEEVDFISIDVSFISLELVLPVASRLLKEDGSLVILIKPQFEAGRDKVGKNGIVRDKKVHLEVIEKIVDFSQTVDLAPKNLSYSPITGAKGNIEFILYLEKNEENMISNQTIKDIVDKAHKDLK